MGATVVGIGHAAVDLLGVVPRYPGRDSTTNVLEYSKQGGGTVATALVAASSLGIRARFVGKVGDDELGSYILEGLRELAVDTRHARVVQGGHSAQSFVVVDRETLGRTVFTMPGDVGALDPEEVDLGILDGAQVLLVDGAHPRAQIAAAEAAHDRKIAVLLDAGRLDEGMGELVALADVVLASERFLTEISPRGEIEDSLIDLLRMGPTIAVGTMGKAGSIGLEGQRIVRQAAHLVRAVDTTGAGDVYSGAFACAWARGWPLERSMHFASVAAGFSCRELGSRAAIPDLQEVLGACGWKDLG
jgi:sulfofructose kinase